MIDTDNINEIGDLYIKYDNKKLLVEKGHISHYRNTLYCVNLDKALYKILPIIGEMEIEIDSCKYNHIYGIYHNIVKFCNFFISLYDI